MRKAAEIVPKLMGMVHKLVLILNFCPYLSLMEKIAKRDREKKEKMDKMNRRGQKKYLHIGFTSFCFMCAQMF